MGALILIGLCFGAFLLLVFVIKAVLFGNRIVHEFKTCNVIVDGKKGKGKDLLFQYVIHKRRKEEYCANISYGGKYTHIELGEINLDPNTYAEFINGKVQECERKFQERRDIYISDAGVYLPCTMDSRLWKEYPSMPIVQALSRHLGEFNIHCNAQVLTRIWLPLRQQADFFVHILKHIKLPFFILVNCVIYDKYESAVANLRPVKVRLFNKFSKAETDVYNAQTGEMKQGWVIIPKRWLKYDTRAFEKVVYGNQGRLEPEKRVRMRALEVRPDSVSTSLGEVKHLPIDTDSH